MCMASRGNVLSACGAAHSSSIVFEPICNRGCNGHVEEHNKAGRSRAEREANAW